MTEDRFAARIRQTLNRGLDELPPTALRRMEAARHLALSRQKQLATANVLVPARAGSKILQFFDTGRQRQLLAALALVIGMALAAYLQAQDYLSHIEDVDSALLSDDLPPEAFLDKGFSAWLKDDSSEE